MWQLISQRMLCMSLVYENRIFNSKTMTRKNGARGPRLDVVGVDLLQDFHSFEMSPALLVNVFRNNKQVVISSAFSIALSIAGSILTMIPQAGPIDYPHELS